MPSQDEVDEAKRAAQLALFKRIGSAATPNASLSYANIESLARSYRYAAGGALPQPPAAEK